MPSITDITNQVLAKIGRKPVQDVNNSDDSLIISQQIPLFLEDLLLRATWNFAVGFYTSSTPLTTNISGEFLYNYQLPYNYGRFFRWEFPWATQFGLYYVIMDNVMMTNIQPVNFYYIVNNVDINVISVPFEQALIYYTAWQVALALTNNLTLEVSLGKRFEFMLASAIQQNDYELQKFQTVYNDFDRQSYI